MIVERSVVVVPGISPRVDATTGNVGSLQIRLSVSHHGMIHVTVVRSRAHDARVVGPLGHDGPAAGRAQANCRILRVDGAHLAF
jgi:hypothetical protein